MNTEMLQPRYQDIIHRQKEYVKNGGLHSISERLNNLRKLRSLIKMSEQKIIDALAADMSRPELEAYSSEIIFLYAEIDLALRKLKKWTKKRKAHIPLLLQPGSGYIIPEPYGSVLVISPWNYPIQIALCPVISALAAGNAVILKPSEIAAASSALLEEIINNNFDPEVCHVIEGGKEVTHELIGLKPDYIFFTGSKQTGSIIMEEAAKFLIPVTLELGGKSPCIVHKDVDLDDIMRRILWGKCFNAGQTCIAVDYVLVHESIKDAFVQKLKEYKLKAYGPEMEDSPDYGRIINDQHFERLTSLLSGNIIDGGSSNKSKKYIELTLIDTDTQHPAMKEEIFGPILPILTYHHISEAIASINQGEKPLTIYLYTNDQKIVQEVVKSTSSGSVAINNCLLQIAVPSLPFGGVGSSGMGNYRGIFGFNTFSHLKSVYNKSLYFENSFLYAPYRATFRKLEKIVLWLSR